MMFGSVLSLKNSFFSVIPFLLILAACLLSVTAEGRDKMTTNQLLHTNLKLKSFRHKVLSNNIANINTPGYKAEEVSEIESDTLNKGSFGKLSLRKTSIRHLRGGGSDTNGFVVKKLKDPEELKPNGNNVSLGQQLVKISQNQTDYDTSLQSYKSSASLVASVLGK